MHKKLLYLTLLATLIPIHIFPCAGDPDPTFNDVGFIISTVGPMADLDFANDVAVQPDGKIVSVGETGLLGEQSFNISRYNPDGTPDSGFGALGTGSVAFSFFGSSVNIAYAVKIQPSDNKIVVAGYSEVGGITNQFALARLNTDGSFDTSFGTNGLVVTPFPGGTNNAANAIALESNCKIILAGRSRQPGPRFQTALVRYNLDGTVDTSFGTNGYLLIPVGGPTTNSTANAATVQEDDKIVVVGEADVTANNDFVTARLLPNGTLDMTFGTNGTVVTSFTGADNSTGKSVAMRPNGKILVSGEVGNGAPLTSSTFGLVQYNPDGSPDTQFGLNGNGQITTNFPGSIFNTGNTVLLQSDGKAIVAGITTSASERMLAVARYTEQGTIDTTFGTNGLVQYAPLNFDVSSTTIRSGAALTPDQRITITSTAGDSATQELITARFLNQTLYVTKEASSEIPCPGQNITYTITAYNTGSGGGTVNGVEIEDALPAELTFRSAQTNGENSSFNPATRIWSIPCLRVGQKAQLKIKARVQQCAGNQIICNTAITTYSSVDNVTNSSLFENLGLCDSETLSTMECVSTLPVVYENLNNIENRIDCGVDDANMALCDLNDEVCTIEIENAEINNKLEQVILKLNCLSNFFSATDCLF